MLNHLKKYFTSQEDNHVAEATNHEENVEMTTNTDDNKAELVAQLASQTSALTELQASFAELNNKYTEAAAMLAEVEASKASLVAIAAEEKQAARKEKLENAVGTVKASALLTSLESLDDTAFNTVVEAMEMNLDAEANSAAFKETGVTAEAKVPQEASFVESLTASITKKLTK